MRLLELIRKNPDRKLLPYNHLLLMPSALHAVVSDIWQELGDVDFNLYGGSSPMVIGGLSYWIGMLSRPDRYRGFWFENGEIHGEIKSGDRAVLIETKTSPESLLRSITTLENSGVQVVMVIVIFCKKEDDKSPKSSNYLYEFLKSSNYLFKTLVTE